MRHISIMTAAFFFTSAVLRAEALTCLLHDNSLVNDTVIHLRDVAVVSGTAEPLLQRLRDLSLGESAPPGFSRYVAAQQIRQTVERVVPTLSIRFTGATMTAVKTVGIPKCVGDFEDTIIRFLNSTTSWEPKNAVISVENPSRSFMLLDKPYSIHIKAPTAGLQRARGSVHLYLEIKQCGRHYHIPVVCKIIVKMPVIVTSKPIEKGGRCTPENCTIKTMDITNYKYRCYSSFDSLMSKITVRTLGTGAIVHEKHLQPLPEVEKGQEVMLILRQGPIKLSVRGRARESGITGQTIWVQNLQNHEIMRGTITGKNEVTIKTNKG